MAMLFDTTARVDKLSVGAQQWTERTDKPHTRIEIKFHIHNNVSLKLTCLSGVQLHKTET